MIHILEGTIFIDNTEKFLGKIKKTSKDKNIVIQAFDADKLAGEEHIRFAVKKAMNSFKSGRNIANDPGKEIMLYAAGTRQINRAMKLGVHNGENNIVLVAIGEVFDISAFNEIIPRPVLQYNSSKKDALSEIFNITKEELKVCGEDKIPELVIERIALVDVMK
jgi:KEOPS complex subunit Cgi121